MAWWRCGCERSNMQSAALEEEGGVAVGVCVVIMEDK